MSGAAEILTSLRGRPPAGTWVPCPPDGTWPGNAGYITREDAEAEAHRRGWPAIGRVVDVDLPGGGGWTIRDLHLVVDNPEAHGWEEVPG